MTNQDRHARLLLAAQNHGAALVGGEHLRHHLGLFYAQEVEFDGGSRLSFDSELMMAGLPLVEENSCDHIPREQAAVGG